MNLKKNKTIKMNLSEKLEYYQGLLGTEQDPDDYCLRHLYSGYSKPNPTKYHSETTLKYKLCNFAVRDNDLDLLKWASKNNYVRSPVLTLIACRYGHLDILKYLRSGEDYPYPATFHYNCMEAAAIHGHFEILKYLKECVNRGEDVSDYQVLHGAEKSNNPEIVKWVLENIKDSISVFHPCVKNRNYEIIEMLLSHVRLTEHNCAYMSAGQNNDLEMLNWLKAKGFQVKYVGFNTEKDSTIQTMQWFIDNNLLTREQVLAAAFSSCNRQIINWLYDSCPRNESALILAGKSGDLDLCKELYIQGYPLFLDNKNICHDANLEIVKWAHQNGCPLTERCITDSILNENAEFTTWLLENNCPIGKGFIEACLQSESHNLLEYGLLKKLKCNLKHYLQYVIYNNDLKSIKILKEYGAIFDEKHYCNEAAEYARFEILEFLIDSGCPFDNHIVYSAEKSGNLEMFKYVLSKIQMPEVHVMLLVRDDRFDLIHFLVKEYNMPQDQFKFLNVKSVKMAKFLLDLGLDPKCFTRLNYKNSEVNKFLLENGLIEERKNDTNSCVLM